MVPVFTVYLQTTAFMKVGYLSHLFWLKTNYYTGLTIIHHTHTTCFTRIIFLLFQVWSWDQQHWHSLGGLLELRTPWPYLDPLHPNLRA